MPPARSLPFDPLRGLRVGAVVFGLTAAGCSGGPPPVTEVAPSSPVPVMPGAEAPETVPEPASEGAGGAEDPTAEPAATASAAAPGAPAVTVVIESGEDGRPPPRTVAQLAEAERRRRAESGPPIAVITDRNLAEHATGKLTFVEPEPAGVDGEGGAEGSGNATAGEPVVEGAGYDESLDPETLADREAYWRQSVLGARTRWSEAAARIARLEEEAAGLRRRFYAEDDPHYRDTQVKPAWDRALDLLTEARREADRARDELAVTVERGRRAGALPGWLREGIDLEPERLDLPPSPRDRAERIYEPEEPVIVDERDDGDGGGGP